MSTKIALDNWSLQDVASLMQDGPDLDRTNIINVNSLENSYRWDEIPRLYIQIQLLINLLNDIVLRDELIVDKNFTGTWGKYSSLNRLNSDNIIKAIEYPKSDTDILKLKENIIRQICITDDMRKTQKANEESWEKYSMVSDKYFSQIVWGTAGIISSTTCLGIPYSPYPIRANLLEQTIYSQNPVDVVREVTNWLTSEHSKIFENVTPNLTSRYAKLSLSPFAVKIIEETNHIDDLLENAIQYRNHYSKIRNWISEYQKALDQEDFKTIMKKKKIFTEISNEISKYNGQLNNGQTDISMTFSAIPGIDISNTFNIGYLKNKFGIRSSICKLILNKNGTHYIEKLLGFFELRGIDRVYGLSEYLMKTNKTK